MIVLYQTLITDQQKCIVKRTNFTIFEAAVRTERFLSQFSDTEDEEKYIYTYTIEKFNLM